MSPSHIATRRADQNSKLVKILTGYMVTEIWITTEYLDVDRNNGQFFKAMEWRWLFFSNDGMAMVIENSHHHHRWFLAGSTIGSDVFSMVFPILGTNGSRWLIMRFFSQKKMKFALCPKLIGTWELINRDPKFDKIGTLGRNCHWFVWYLLQLDTKAENLLPSPKINGF